MSSSTTSRNRAGTLVPANRPNVPPKRLIRGKNAAELKEYREFAHKIGITIDTLMVNSKNKVVPARIANVKCIVRDHMTNEDLYRWMELILNMGAFTIRSQGWGGTVLNNDASSLLGVDAFLYLVPANGSPFPHHIVTQLQTSNNVIPRSVTGSEAARAGTFRARVFNRDMRCLATGVWASLMDNARFNSNLYAAHLFPHSRCDSSKWLGLSQQARCDLDDCWGYTDASYVFHEINPVNVGINRIDTIRNGILLRSDPHIAFDNFDWGVDYRNNYRIVKFAPELIEEDYLETLDAHDSSSREGRPFPQRIAYEGHRPADQLFLNQFRDCLNKHVFVPFKPSGQA